MRVLVVEDEVRQAAALKRGLEAEGFAVDVASNGTDGLWLATEQPYDAIVLDVMLPGLNGYKVCAELRAKQIWTPVLMLTAKDGELDEAEALDTGADDFLSKPFSYVVLVARLRALLRRGATDAAARAADPAASTSTSPRRTCLVDGEQVELTPREFSVVEYLMRRARRGRAEVGDPRARVGLRVRRRRQRGRGARVRPAAEAGLGRDRDRPRRRLPNGRACALKWRSSVRSRATIGASLVLAVALLVGAFAAAGSAATGVGVRRRVAARRPGRRGQTLIADGLLSPVLAPTGPRRGPGAGHRCGRETSLPSRPVLRATTRLDVIDATGCRRARRRRPSMAARSAGCPDRSTGWWRRTVRSAVGPLTIYAVTSLDTSHRAERYLRNSMLIGLPLLVGLAAWLISRVVARALAPVDAMRAEVDRIEAADLSGRVRGGLERRRDRQPRPDAEPHVGSARGGVEPSAVVRRGGIARVAQPAVDASHRARGGAGVSRSRRVDEGRRGFADRGGAPRGADPRPASADPLAFDAGLRRPCRSSCQNCWRPRSRCAGRNAAITLQHRRWRPFRFLLIPTRWCGSCGTCSTTPNGTRPARYAWRCRATEAGATLSVTNDGPPIPDSRAGADLRTVHAARRGALARHRWQWARVWRSPDRS